MARTKKCKGVGICKGFGCGVELPYTERNGIRSYKAKYGLGYDCRCLAKWSMTTKEGKEWLNKESKSNLKKKKTEKNKKQRKLDRKMKIDLMSTTEYWSNVFQPRFNQIIKIIDKGNGCIATNSTLGKMNAGHYYSVGSNKTLSLNSHNVHIQSEHSNSYKGGQPIEYLEGMKRVYGEEYADFVVSLKRCPALNITKIELIELYQKLLEIRRDLLKQELFQLSPLERIELRNDLNTKLGLYQEEFSVFKNGQAS